MYYTQLLRDGRKPKDHFWRYPNSLTMRKKIKRLLKLDYLPVYYCSQSLIIIYLEIKGPFFSEDDETNRWNDRRGTRLMNILKKGAEDYGIIIKSYKTCLVRKTTTGLYDSFNYSKGKI